MSEYAQKKELYGQLSASVLHIIEGLMKKENIKYASAVFRVKDADSLSDKIVRKEEKYKTLSDITDIGGIRIITYYADDVDRVAELIEREFRVDRENSIDKRKALEPNVFGYLSLHYVICLDDRRSLLPEYEDLKELRIEVQIRSILQHSWAEMEHDMGYKSKIEVPREIIRDFSRLAGLLEIADKEFQEIRQKLSQYEREVARKIENNERDTVIRLDAVSLQILLDTDKDFISFNQDIENSTGIKIDSDKANYEGILRMLQWFGITTVGDVKKLLKEEERLAVYFVQKTLKKSTRASLGRTMGLLYLSYAKLATEYPKERWAEFFRDNFKMKAGENTDIVEALSRLYSSYSEEKE